MAHKFVRFRCHVLRANFFPSLASASAREKTTAHKRSVCPVRSRRQNVIVIEYRIRPEMDQDEALQQRLRQARTKLKDLQELIKEKSKELCQLRRQKKETEEYIESLESTPDTRSFKDAFPWTKDVHAKLSSIFGIQTFRQLQEEVINVTLSKRDCIYVAATGSGKSLVFQLPALVSPGITLVVSPLLSLMEDQTNQLDMLGIPASVINSSTSREEFKELMRAMIDPQAPLKIIYVTPEKLAKSKTFMSQLEKSYELGRLSRLVIDEVHCCSEWGHDFRKDYKSLHIFKRQFPETPILGLTATATPQVILDIQKMLDIEKCLVFTGTFYRPNLTYEIRATSTRENISDIADLITGRFYNQSGIIYCLTIKDTEDVAEKLTELGVSCQAYHAQLDLRVRNSIQQQWYTGRCKVISATVAFGLGINKMDVRFVIHHTISKSMENYYQETGRAGRDGKPAACICFYRFSDVFRATSLTFRERNGQQRVYRMLSYCLERQVCRKKLLADYFEDTKFVKSSSDRDCCDNCRYKTNLGNPNHLIDASDWLQDLLGILIQANQKKMKLTSNMLIEAWMQVKGPKKLRLDGVNKPSLSRTDCETVVGFLLCGGFFKEDFHMTPYSTISYIIPGPNSIMGRQRSGLMIPAAALEGYVPPVPTKGQTNQSREFIEPKRESVVMIELD